MSFSNTQRHKLEQYLRFILPTLENNEVEKGYIFANNPKTSFENKYVFNTYHEGLELLEKLQYNNCYIGLSTIKNKQNNPKYINRTNILEELNAKDEQIQKQENNY